MTTVKMDKPSANETGAGKGGTRILPEQSPGSGTVRTSHEQGLSSASSGAGFRAHLNGATLSDLIQFECMDRSRKIVRVLSGARSAVLYFRNGNLVHAVEGKNVGEAAVRALLQWPTGVFEAWKGPWPREESITLPWQNLLLRAAHAEDEENRKPKVVALRKESGSSDTPPSAEVEDTTETTITVRLSSSGDTIGGSAPPEFAEGVAYAATIADVLGELLGIESMTAIEYSLSQGSCVIGRDGTGAIDAALGREIDVSSLKTLIESR